MRWLVPFLVAGLLGILVSTQHYVTQTQRSIMNRLNYAEEFDKAIAQRLIEHEGMIEGNAKNILLITKYLVKEKHNDKS